MSVAAAGQLSADRETSVVVDEPGGTNHFAYDAEDGRHTVWIAPADAMHAEIREAQASGIARIALWRLGTEDPAFRVTRRAAPQ